MNLFDALPFLDILDLELRMPRQPLPSHLVRGGGGGYQLGGMAVNGSRSV